MNLRKQLPIICSLFALFIPGVAYSGLLNCTCCQDSEEEQPLQRKALSSESELASTFSAKKPPQRLEEARALSLEDTQLLRFRLDLFRKTEIRAEKFGEEIYLNAIPSGDYFLYFASRSKKHVEADDEASIDKILLLTPTLGTKISSLPTVMQHLYVCFGELPDYDRLRSLAETTSKFLGESPSSIRQLSQEDGSLYFFIQNAVTIEETTRVIILAWINKKNKKLGLELLPRNRRFTLHSSGCALL